MNFVFKRLPIYVFVIFITVLMTTSIVAAQTSTQPPAGEPQTAEGFMAFGDYYTEAGDYGRAIAYYTLAIQLKPDWAEAYNNRGYAHYWNYVQTGGAGAIADFDRALALRPDYPNAYNNRCLAYLTVGSAQQAVNDCTQAIHLQPKFPQAYMNRANAYLQLGRLDLAFADFRHEGMFSRSTIALYLAIPLTVVGVMVFMIIRRRQMKLGLSQPSPA
ncbi:MAG: tetratricopeptide repeat protein [Anaerolineae bacterium]